jgi:hypothetical protein
MARRLWAGSLRTLFTSSAESMELEPEHQPQQKTEFRENQQRELIFSIACLQ